MDKSKKERLLDITRDEGEEANCSGVPREGNPYFRFINPDDYNAWYEGWDESEKEAGRPWNER